VRIALLEDDPVQATTIAAWLTKAGHDTRVFGSATSFQRHWGHESFDTFLIDWMLPDQSGHDVLLWLRKEHGETAPIVFVTCRDAEEDVVSALSAGADDYMIKPVRRLEFLSRLEALWRRGRTHTEQSDVVELPPFRFELASRRVLRDGVLLEPLTEKEFHLALFLFQNIGRLLSRGHLMEAIWGLSASIPTRTLDTHISRIRRKLDLHAYGLSLTPTYNYGYRLDRVDRSG
jgi:DNA-binding response OmpR family regulator